MSAAASTASMFLFSVTASSLRSIGRRAPRLRLPVACFGASTGAAAALIAAASRAETGFVR